MNDPFQGLVQAIADEAERERLDGERLLHLLADAKQTVEKIRQADTDGLGAKHPLWKPWALDAADLLDALTLECMPDTGS